MNHNIYPVVTTNKVKDGKINVAEYALVSLVITPQSVSLLTNKIQIKTGLDHKHFDPAKSILEGFVWSHQSINVLIILSQFALKGADFWQGAFHLVLSEYAN